MLDSSRRSGSPGPTLERLVAHSQSMRQLMALIRAVAPSDCSALITGETGVGKECVARAIHTLSHRSGGRLFAVHCAAIPPTLLEAELFGHERGAFTGAETRQKGAFEAAGGGTFLLDEIGELDPALQVKLLRVLQEKEIMRLGSTDTVPVDVRILATTNRDLRAEAEKGTFRRDLFYRLNTVEIHVPPLRERREDILALAGEFLAEAQARGISLPIHGEGWGGGCLSDARPRVPSEQEEARPRELSPAAATCLLHYDWPGNVRELLSVIERACLLCTAPRIEPRHLPAEVVQPTLQTPIPAEGDGAPESPVGCADLHTDRRADLHALPGAGVPPARAPLDFRAARRQFERDYFLCLLAQCNGNISAAARAAGLSWKHFRHKMYALHIRIDA